MHRLTWILGRLMVVLVLLAPVPAPAAPEVEKEADKAHAGKEADKAHPPAEHKRSPFDGMLDTTVWTIVVFLVFLSLLTKFAWKPMLEGLKKREDDYAAAKLEAEDARRETARLDAEKTAELNKMAAQVRDALEEARRDAVRLKEEKRAEGMAEVQAERERLMREVDMVKAQNLEAVSKLAADLATAISAKVVRRTLSAEDHRRLVDEALAEVAPAGQERQQVVGGIQT